MSDYHLLDTGKFDDFLSQRSNLLNTYNRLNKEYDAIIKELMQNWKGRGAEAFETDAKKVKTNIAGIQDILQTMCDTLEDCLKVFQEYDSSLGKANREAVI